MGEEASKPVEKQDEKDAKKRKLLGIEPVETHHKIAVGDRELGYIARSGGMALTDDLGEIEAEIFFTAYDLDLEPGSDRMDRPLAFVFNGGPGSSSVWLHMGALGPKRVRMQEEGWMPPPPYRYGDNQHTWLDQVDLVFVDPAGTGFSRAAKEELDKRFWSFQGDIESVGEFIRLYLTRYKRWTSPLFLAGESYGTTRAAALAGHLVDRGITFNGIILISTVLDMSAIHFTVANDLPYALFVPTYTATAWFHDRLDESLQSRSLPDLMAEVTSWSETELTVALMKGDRLGEEERRRISETLAHYTGLDPDYVLGTNLRVDIHRFCKELLRESRRSVGRLDSRFQGVEALAVNERPEFDPSMLAITPPYTAALNQYVRSELGVETDLVYETLSMTVNQKWEWQNGMLPATGEALRGAIAKNPYMKVLVGQGYYDLATPHFATQYMITHMNIDPELRGNVEMKNYEAGHMFYLDEASLAAFKNDVDEFITRSV